MAFGQIDQTVTVFASDKLERVDGNRTRCSSPGLDSNAWLPGGGGRHEASHSRTCSFLDWVPSGWHGAWYYGAKKGCFSDRDIEVSLERGMSGGDSVTKVASGTSELGLADIGTMILAVANSGAPVRAIMPVSMENPFGILTLEENRMSTLSMLENKTLGAGPGDSVFQVLPYATAREGGDFKKVNVEQVDFSALLGMLLQKRLDAFTTFRSTAAILDTSAESMGRKVAFYHFGKKIDAYGLVLFANTGFLTEKPDVAQRVIEGLQCAYTLARNDPDGVVDALLEEFPDRKRAVELASVKVGIDETFQNDAFDKHGFSWDPDRVRRNLEFTLSAHGLDPSRVDVSDIVWQPAKK